MALFLIVSAALLLGGNALKEWLAAIMASITAHFSWLYLGIYIVNFVFFLGLACSHIGKIKLGDVNDKPAYSNFQWGSMVFATAIDASILMLSMVDPLRYVQQPLFGAKAMSAQNYQYAHMLGQFDWGPMAWMMFASAAVIIGYMMFVKHVHVMALSDAMPLLQGKGRTKRSLRLTVNFLVVFGIMGGIGSSVGMEIPVLAKIIAQISGIADTIWLKLALFVVLLVIFGLTMVQGLKGGIDRLSSMHIWTAIGFLVIVLLVGPTGSIIRSEMHSLGALVTRFAAMSTGLATATGGVNPVKSETVFYWGWWLTYMPFMGLFIARISKGRTIRQVIFGMLGFGALGCMAFYAILGGYSLSLQQSGAVNLIHTLNTQGQAATIAQVLTTLPFKYIMLVVYGVSCFIFLATTVSSSAYIVSAFTSTRLKATQQPSLLNRMVWMGIFMLFAFGIVFVGGFKTVQAICSVAGFPLIFVSALLIFSTWKLLVKDHSVVLAPQPVKAKVKRQVPRVLPVAHDSLHD
ncbi:BCCT family transporter [Lacticaseibacillus thailandensis]|uniref:Choline-glycine betaine transporter n=1 Tax=Lacticaseibacillus thailandensis DSM 22698 = JCM 13996 TaxID=1423810 RepID=A0A0R2C8N9_9LACO|nr:BCCT family transporter [Lacticaseibacillus thailandensis]KRM88161.1 choline-glycine betaine transporter [Lacticaseibacillus thailandensis DSM 22698 = JCM 13996]